MPRTRSQTAALLAQQITELAMGDMTNRITNTSNKKHKTPPNKQNTPKKKKKRRKRGSSLSMRKKATNTKGIDSKKNASYFNKTESIRKCTIKSKQNEIAKKKQIYRESVLKSQEDKIKTLKTKQKELNLFKSYQIIPFYGSQSVLEQELNGFINKIRNENAKVNLYKKKCEFYADRLRIKDAKLRMRMINRTEYVMCYKEKLNLNGYIDS